ncbi:MAG: hypothetical protein DRN66_03275 [Candidatus Nanohalarchaeota archaeon]|nr:MAG: hypothetical protein DRN66_03275 [Candidatus Nanohaloarchaeota archaeon]
MDEKYIVLESHPNLMGLWIGKIGTKEEVQKYVDKMDPSYLNCILRLEEGADIQEKTAEEFGLVWDEEAAEWKRKLEYFVEQYIYKTHSCKAWIRDLVISEETEKEIVVWCIVEYEDSVETLDLRIDKENWSISKK